ncbi:hypothetical protein [Streptomyces sp. NBC_01508]|uniref:hypothetical protein n=1 Tax=Streptomyces sp. NBC_01508 TaxID=2903888 RepID=UPI00386DDBF9
MNGAANPEPGEGTSGNVPGINGGVAGGADFRPQVLFPVGVPDMEAALADYHTPARLEAGRPDSP